MKICKKCGIEKQLNEFRKSKRHKDGYLNECKDCISIKRRQYYLDNIGQHKIITKEYYEKNKEIIYEKVDKDKKRENNRRYMKKNKDKIKEKSRKYYEKNKDKIKEKSRKYYEKNKDKINCVSDRKKEIRKRSYKKRKYQYIWREILRKTISQLKSEKNQTTLAILKYDYNELKIYLESKFEEGMTWENHGEWHVDHIIPISIFKEGTDPSIVNKLNNLRPIWAKDNLIKQNKIYNIGEEFNYLLNEFSDYIKI